MTLSEIKSAVESGQTVCWSNESYQVIKDKHGNWFIKCLANNHCTGLSWADECTLNGKESDFFVLQFNFETLFNPQPKPAPVPDAVDVQREQKYQQSRFSKKWAATYAEAVAKTVKEYTDAKKQRDDWASRVYTCNMKAVIARGWSEYEQRQTTVYEANERRRDSRIRAAELTMQEAIHDLRELGLTPGEINKLTGSIKG